MVPHGRVIPVRTLKLKVMADRFRAFLIHLACSVAVASVLAYIVFGVWYPAPSSYLRRDAFALGIEGDVLDGCPVAGVLRPAPGVLSQGRLPVRLRRKGGSE